MDYRTVRTLLGIAGLYASALAASRLFLRWYRPEEVADPGMPAALLAVPLACSVGYLWGSRRYFREARLLVDAAERPVLEDGRRVVAVGPVEALAPVLKAPLTGKVCVAYQYEIDHEVKRPGHPPRRVRDYWGMAVSPFQIRTPSGPVRILGYARLEGAVDLLTEEDAYRSAEAYFRATSFRHPTSAGERYGSLAEPLSTESDTFGDDICADGSHIHLGQASGADLRKLDMRERRLQVGQTVSAAGQYSAAKKALVPTTRAVEQLRISSFGPENWALENREWGQTYVKWGIGFGIFAVACALASRWC